MRTRRALAGLAILALWTFLMGYLYSIGVFSDDPVVGGDDAASGAIERGLYGLIWLVVAVAIVLGTIAVLRHKPELPSN